MNNLVTCPNCNGQGLITIETGTEVCSTCSGAGGLDINLGEPVRFKKLSELAVIPSYAKPGDAGLDLTAIDDGVDTWPEDNPSHSYYYREYKTGLAVEIPHGYVGLIFPRSSISNTCLTLANCVGVIDSGYRGEIKFRFKMDGSGLVLKNIQGGKAYRAGDRVGQLIIMPYPRINVVEAVGELSESERGSSGFGSSGT